MHRLSDLMGMCAFLVQLADFGLSRALDHEKHTHISTQTYGTVAYMPPELLSNSRLTRSADIYSFGMLMWELSSGQVCAHPPCTSSLTDADPPHHVMLCAGFSAAWHACQHCDERTTHLLIFEERNYQRNAHGTLGK